MNYIVVHQGCNSKPRAKTAFCRKMRALLVGAVGIEHDLTPLHNFCTNNFGVDNVAS